MPAPAGTGGGCRPDPELRFHRAGTVPAGSLSPNAVPNAMLRSAMVPAPDAPWEDLEEFALTYDGYSYWSDVAELDRRTMQRWTRERHLPADLDELRGCLFYEERRWHGFGREPHGRARDFIGALLGAIVEAIETAGCNRAADAS